MVSGCLAPITQKAFIRQGAWSFLGWWLDRRYVQDRGNLEPQQYPRKIFRYEPVCLRWSQVVGRLVVNFYPSLWPFCDFHIYGDCFFGRLGDFTKAGVKNHQFWSLVFVTCRSEISTSGANRKKRAGVFFEGKMKLLAEKTMESYIMLVVVFGCSFLRMFFSVVSHDSLTLAGSIAMEFWSIWTCSYRSLQS